ncbi:MAG TPA: type III polyketide synthase [Gammaproteobacteria bacterium]|nr:type III polyketide synthase [Gammaproteobacteria bacterium]
MRAAQAGLHGIGVATPAGTLDQEAAAAFATPRCCADERQQAFLQRIYRHSGVQRRASVLMRPHDDTTALEAFYPPPTAADDLGPTTAVRLRHYAAAAGPLAAEACRAAFADAATDPTQITHLVTVSCTGLISPGLDAELIERLGLSPDIGRINLGFMGCHGALNGLRTASALAQSGPDARILLCCVELCTLHFRYGWDLQKIVANALFADGAAAVVVGPAGDRSESYRLVDTTSRLALDSSDAMIWRIGDHGFEMTLSREVPRLIRGAIGAWLHDWLARHALSVPDVAHWAIHPGGPKVIQAVTESLALPAAAGRTSASVLAEHGNMSSPTVLFILQRLRAQAANGPCVVLGFGPGLALEGALLH